jgi:hypothetical protein
MRISDCGLKMKGGYYSLLGKVVRKGWQEKLPKNSPQGPFKKVHPGRSMLNQYRVYRRISAGTKQLTGILIT